MKKKNRKPVTKKKNRKLAAIPSRKIVSLSDKLDEIYHIEDLDTTCCRQCTCCRVACPQMKFSEATNIIDKVLNSWNKQDKKALLMSCVKYYFSDSLVKPCLLLKGNECSVYEHRPLNCRLYGLWPNSAWDRRVEMFSNQIGLPKDKLPLNTQCCFVRRKNTADPLGEEKIGKLFDMLDDLDLKMKVTPQQISSSWNYRTLHDWMILKFWGENALVQWTNIILSTSQDERESILEIFEKVAMEKLGLE